MPTRKPEPTPNITEYTPATGKTVVYTIEYVVDPLRTDSDGIERILGECDSYGHGGVVKRQLIAEGFSDACDILDRRRC